MLRAVVGLDAKAAAAVLGKGPGAVRTAAYRGLRTLAGRVGGVATAAATGALPLPAGGSAPATSASSLPAATGSSDAPASTRGQGKTRAENEPSPSPSLTGLCHAYTAGNKAEHGKALESPAFTALVTAAGGMTKVDDYCITLLKDESAKP